MSMYIKSLQSIRAIKRAGSDGIISTAVHIKPPEEVGTAKTGSFLSHRFPNLFTINQAVGLLPEMVFVEGAFIPSIAN